MHGHAENQISLQYLIGGMIPRDWRMQKRLRFFVFHKTKSLKNSFAKQNFVTFF